MPESENLRDLASFILRKDTYIDTVRAYFNRPLTGDQIAELRRLVGSLMDVRAMPRQFAKWPTGVTLHQPRSEAFEYLKTLADKVIISRLDVALDLVTASRLETRQLQAYLDAHLVQRWHGKNRLCRYKETRYYGSSTARNKPVMYDDKPSRLDGGYCCHIEWRIKTASAVSAAGIATLDDLLRLDFRAFWTKRILLRGYPESTEELESLGKSALGKPKRKKPWIKPYKGHKGIGYNVFLRTGGALMRSASVEGQVIVQDAIDTWGKFGRRHFPVLASDWLLP